jgi:hypothetical protein
VVNHRQKVNEIAAASVLWCREVKADGPMAQSEWNTAAQVSSPSFMFTPHTRSPCHTLRRRAVRPCGPSPCIRACGRLSRWTAVAIRERAYGSIALHPPNSGHAPPMAVAHLNAE